MAAAKDKDRKRLSPTGHVVLFFALFAVWEVLDRITKTYFESTLTVGQTIPGPVPGIFTCTLVHNTGGAWGMLSSATFLLGVFSLVVCVLIAVYACRFNRGATALETACLALVCAGGFGNAVDRFALGYVVDFFNLSFIDFPVFNVADIGVTVGMIIFFVALLIRTFCESKGTPAAGGDVVPEVGPEPVAPVQPAEAPEAEAEVVAIITNQGVEVLDGGENR